MALLRWLARQLLRALGWRFLRQLPHYPPRAVLVVAPHTSNWDGFYGLLCCLAHKLPIRFAIKKEALRFPLGLLLRPLGAIPISRARKALLHKRHGQVQALAALFQQPGPLLLVIAPEGTRKRAPRWRRGFYHIAQQAGVPLVLGYIDYGKKHLALGPVWHPTGSLAKDLPQLQGFYQDKVGRYPAQGVHGPVVALR